MEIIVNNAQSYKTAYKTLVDIYKNAENLRDGSLKQARIVH